MSTATRTWLLVCMSLAAGCASSKARPPDAGMPPAPVHLTPGRIVIGEEEVLEGDLHVPVTPRLLAFDGTSWLASAQYGVEHTAFVLLAPDGSLRPGRFTTDFRLNTVVAGSDGFFVAFADRHLYMDASGAEAEWSHPLLGERITSAAIRIGSTCLLAGHGPDRFSTDEIALRSVRLEGATLSPPREIIVASPSYYPSLPRMATDGVGTVALVWSASETSGPATTSLAIVADALGASPAITLVTLPGRAGEFRPSIAWDGAAFLIASFDEAGAVVRRMALDGTMLTPAMPIAGSEGVQTLWAQPLAGETWVIGGFRGREPHLVATVAPDGMPSAMREPGESGVARPPEADLVGAPLLMFSETTGVRGLHPTSGGPVVSDLIAGPVAIPADWGDADWGDGGPWIACAPPGCLAGHNTFVPAHNSAVWVRPVAPVGPAIVGDAVSRPGQWLGLFRVRDAFAALALGELSMIDPGGHVWATTPLEGVLVDVHPAGTVARFVGTALALDAVGTDGSVVPLTRFDAADCPVRARWGAGFADGGGLFAWSPACIDCAEGFCSASNDDVLTLAIGEDGAPTGEPSRIADVGWPTWLVRTGSGYLLGVNPHGIFGSGDLTTSAVQPLDELGRPRGDRVDVSRRASGHAIAFGGGALLVPGLRRLDVDGTVVDDIVVGGPVSADVAMVSISRGEALAVRARPAGAEGPAALLGRTIRLEE